VCESEALQNKSAIEVSSLWQPPSNWKIGISTKFWSRLGGKEYSCKWCLPTGDQYFNGQAEWIIGILKKQMQRSFEDKRYSHKKVCTLLQETAQIVNSRSLDFV
jgi:hypothetical protein